MTILTVTYAFARAGRDSAGGAEQVAAMLDRGIVAAGARSIVIAAEGSEVCGELVPIPLPECDLTPAVQAKVRERQRSAIATVLSRESIELVHMHGIDFHQLLPDASVPVLATLHLPLAWYPPHALQPVRPHTYLHCVSHAQHGTRPADTAFLPPILNGVPVDRLMYRRRPGSYALCLGRICEEKGFHLGVQAARLAGVPAVVAGRVFPYEAHEAYFARTLAPLLDVQRRYVGPADFLTKRRLLAYARCLLVCSTIPETSSLSAMEALASGTPVIAFRNGALPDIVEHGKTGFLVDSVEEMADAIRAVGAIDRAECRRAAEERFGEKRMIAEYLALYSRITADASTTVDAAF